jgi:hypothetical protein
MKRTLPFALLAIAAAALFSSAQPSASPPAASDHPLALTQMQPSEVVEAAPFADIDLTAASELRCELNQEATVDTGPSASGVKRVGAKPSTYFYAPDTGHHKPPARAVRA